MNKYLLFLLIPLLACMASCSDDDPQDHPKMLFSIESVSNPDVFVMKYDSPDPPHAPWYYNIYVVDNTSLEMTLEREDSSNPIMFPYTGNYYAVEDEQMGVKASVAEDELTLQFTPITLSPTNHGCFTLRVRDKDDKTLGTSFAIYRCEPEALEDLKNHL